MRALRFAIAMLFLSSGSAAAANLLVNGDFEQGTPTGAFTTLPAGSTAITGWVVSRTDVDIVGTYWHSQSGARSIDLDGLHPGCLSQTIATVPGATYNLSFYLAGNPCLTALKQMRVSAAGQSADFSFNTTGHSTANMGWTLETWSFVANSTSTTLDLCSLDASGSCGPGVDNVVLDGSTPAANVSWGKFKIIYR